VRINNVNHNNKTNKNYCFDCFYLIKVTAERPTEASIIIPTPDSELSITSNALIKDILLANETTVFRVFTDSTSQFELNLQYGKIRIMINEQNEGQAAAYDKVHEPTRTK
jgi:hypothetical protein